MRRPPVLAIDFDGTITDRNEFPEANKIKKDCKDVLTRLHDRGCTHILWTCRTKSTLDNAVKYCKDNNIPIDYVNENIPDIQDFAYPKIFANEYIDDANIGGFLGWLEIEKIIINKYFEGKF